MSRKAGEDGIFWEWRTFGTITDRARRTLARCERRGSGEVVNEDLYFISALTEQNVKLRHGSDQLKLKPLLVRLDDGLELYEESPRWIWPLPAPPEGVAAAAGLLGISLEASEPWNVDRLRAAFKIRGSGVITSVTVRKRRTQYLVGEGWAEIAELEFPAGAVTSLGLQSHNLNETRRLRDMLDPDRGLTPMNYVEACRTWGSAE